MNQGELFKQLRKERGLTQSQLAKGITSRTALATFENHESEITLSHAMAYLERLNITLEEYEFIYHKHNVSKKHLATRYLGSSDMAEAEKYTQVLLDKYQNSKDNYFFYLYVQRELLNRIHYGHTFFTNIDNLTTRVKTYLNRVETWGHFEIVLFLNCLFVFDSSYILNTVKNVLPKSEEYQETLYFTKDIPGLCHNGIGLGITRHDLQLVSVFSDKLAQNKKTDNSTVSFVLNQFFSAIKTYLNDNNSKSFKEAMNKTFQLLDLLQLSFWEPLLKSYLKQIGLD